LNYNAIVSVDSKQ